MATLVRQRLAEHITIDPFDETSVAGILTVLGGSAPPPARAIHDATEGNVFFIEETFRHLSEEGRQSASSRAPARILLGNRAACPRLEFALPSFPDHAEHRTHFSSNPALF